MRFLLVKVALSQLSACPSAKPRWDDLRAVGRGGLSGNFSHLLFFFFEARDRDNEVFSLVCDGCCQLCCVLKYVPCFAIHVLVSNPGCIWMLL
jgi:hypothetical protein